MSLKLIFAGTPAFALPTLLALIQSEHTVIAVYTQPDRRAGRGKQYTASPVKLLAQEAGIPVIQPLSLRDTTAQERFIHYHADMMVVVAYGILLPPAILSAPRLGCINIHPSLLPRWRGAAPIQQALLAGDTTTGVTLMQMDAGLDSGDIFIQTHCPIGLKDTSGSLHPRLAQQGADLLLANLTKIAAGMLKPIQQNIATVTYAPRIHKKEAELDWTLAAHILEKQIRAFNPKPVAFSYLHKELLRIWQAEVMPDQEANTIATDAPPGLLLQASRRGLDIATGQGILRLTQLQKAGKKTLSAQDFLNAYQQLCIPLHTWLGRHESTFK